MGLWSRKMSERDREITESLKALTTLRMEQGRVSIDPCEVIDRPGYLQARTAARELVRLVTPDPAHRLNWQALEEPDVAHIAELIALHLLGEKQKGRTLDEAIKSLRDQLASSTAR